MENESENDSINEAKTQKDLPRKISGRGAIVPLSLPRLLKNSLLSFKFRNYWGTYAFTY